MPKLDRLVLDHLADKLFVSDRLEVVLQTYMERSLEGEATRRAQLGRVRKAKTEAEGKISRLLQLVAQGAMDSADPIMREQLDRAKQERLAAADQIAWLETQASTSAPAITPEKVERLAGRSAWQ